MKKVKKYLGMFSPFNNQDEMPAAVYIIKKLFAFWLIYILASILQQIVVTGAFFIGGYDPVGGVLPAENVQTVVLYYGFALYLLLTFLYCKRIEKRSIKSTGFTRKISDYITGAGIAVLLLLVIMGICCIAGAISFTGINDDRQMSYVIALLGGLIVQGAAEEAMCRGFLMTSLLKKASVPTAVFWSATMFALPHFGNLFASDSKYAAVGILNIYLISAIFSLLMLYRRNIWISCGLHSIWNFIIYGVLGLVLSGQDAAEGFLCFEAEKTGLLTGGAYGIESSIVTTVVLAVFLVVIYRIWSRERRKTDGI